jgi:D-arabinose 1-dehydrogenase-like Zn-dependent alcohol dehydrogenase
VGIQGVQLAEAMDLRPIVVDTGEEKKTLALSLGAEHFVDFKDGDPHAKVVELADGQGAHPAFVTAPQAYPDALKYLGSRVGGQVSTLTIGGSR